MIFQASHKVTTQIQRATLTGIIFRSLLLELICIHLEALITLIVRSHNSVIVCRKVWPGNLHHEECYAIFARACAAQFPYLQIFPYLLYDI